MSPPSPSRDGVNALLMHVEPDTWCNPLYSIGPVYDLMVEAWTKRQSPSPAMDKQYYGFAQREIDLLLKLVAQAIDLRVQDTKGMRKLIEKLKSAYVEGYPKWSSWPLGKGKELASRRLDPMPELFNLQMAPNFVLNFVAELLPVYGNIPPKVKDRQRTSCTLYYFDKYRIEEAELAWRVKDAGDAAKSQLRGRERIAAFEAMWLGNEQERAYAFVGAKLPPQWHP